MNIFDKFNNFNYDNKNLPKGSLRPITSERPENPLQQEDSWAGFTGSNLLNSPWQLAKVATQYSNSHVAICVSVLADAVSQLPADIIKVETSNGTRTEVDDNNHPANSMFKAPNPETTWSDFMTGIVSSLLLDGNAYIAIDIVPGGYELYLQDPTSTQVNVSKDNKRILSYEFGPYDTRVVYPRERVIHMRELNIKNHLKGKSRLDALREELTMDEYIKQYNANFFKNGGTIGWMWTPEKFLNKEQHKQIQRAIRNSISGVTRAFSLFINRFPGKLETPNQKHKDIAFLELLKYIRETINGVFHVPPYKAGVLEYANYANSTQQQESFWTDGVLPLLRRIQDIINKDFIWKYYDENHELKFNLRGVKALQGNPIQKMQELTGYKKEGILTIDEVRAEIGREPLNADQQKASATADKYGQALQDFFEAQKARVFESIDKITINGSFKTYLEVADLNDIFNIKDENKRLEKMLSPLLRGTALTVGNVYFDSLSEDQVFNMNSDSIKTSLNTLISKYTSINEKTLNAVEQLKDEAIISGWEIRELKNRIADTLCSTNAKKIGKEIADNIVRRVRQAAEKQATQNTEEN